jgi:hypothetical protein
MDELLFLMTGTGPSVRTPSGAWATMGELLFLKDRHRAVWSHAIGGMGNYGRVALSQDRHRAVWSHAIGGMGNYGRVALSQDRPGAVCSHAIRGMGTYGRGALSQDRPGAVCSHACGGMGTYGRGALSQDRPGAVCSHAIGGMGNYGRVALSRGHTASHHGRQGGPAASQAIRYPVSRRGNITALLIRHRWLRNHSVSIHRRPSVLHYGAPCGRRFRNHSEHRRCRNHSAVNSGWRHHRIICVIIIAVGGQRWQDSGILIEVGSAELQPHFTWLAGLACSLTSHGRRKQNSSPAQTR